MTDSGHSDPGALAPQAFRLLQEHGSDIIWTVDLEMRPLYLSPSVEHILGFPPEAGLGQPAERLLTPQSLARARRFIRDHLAGRPVDTRTEPLELEFKRRDGTVVETESVLTTLRDAEGRPTGFIGITRDVSERRLFREELRSRNELLETIFANLRQIFFSVDLASMRVETISSACESIYGLPAQAFYDDPQIWLKHVLEEDLERITTGLDELRRGERDESVAEYRIRRTDESVRWLRSRIRVHRNADGFPDKLHGFVTDISTRKRLEEQLLQAQKMEAVGTLAGGIAHDMNNVLGVVMGLGSVLQAGLEEDHPMRRHVEGILNAARRGRDLTSNLLGFARKGHSQHEPVSLNTVVEECLELIQRTVAKSVVVKTRLSGVLDSVDGDPNQLNQAFMNLCLNAIDAMPEGGTLMISTTNLRLLDGDRDQFPKLAAGRYVRVQVADTGEGISAENLARVFEPFFTTKPRGQGTGLGLAMVYGTMTTHGGAIEIESTPGTGTTVTLLLPAKPPRRAEVRPAALPRETPAMPGGTVLLVDDEELFRYTGELMLSQLGYDTLAVENGASALEVCRHRGTELSLVLLDLQMPVMDGEETYQKLRDLVPGVPVLLCSGYAREEKAERLLAAGAQGYLHKPFELKTLRRAIHKALATPPSDA